MPKIALVADVHLANHRRWGGPVEGGLNRRGREAVDVLRRACLMAKEHGCDALFVLGDLFDTSRPSPPLIAAALDALERGPKAYVLLGNHDRQSQHPRDNACAPMAFTFVEVISQPCSFRYGNLKIACVPYQPGDASAWLPDALATACGPDRAGKTLALTHLGIWDDNTAPYMKAARDAVGLGQVRWLCEARGVDAFVAGNWHHQQLWVGPPPVMIPGTLCPHSFSDAGFSNVGGLVIYDSEQHGLYSIRVAGPRFHTVTADTIGATQAGPKGSEWRTYYRLRCGRGELQQALSLRESMESGFEAEVEVEVVDDAANINEAAAAAISASNGDLTEDYAELAAVKEPGTREGVQRRLAEYRKMVGT